MISKIYSSSLNGIDARQIEIEVNVSYGDPRIITVGLPDASVRESSVRVNSAINSSGFERLSSKAVVNLAPANLRKEGSGFDLPIALGIILSIEGVSQDFSKFCIVGELALNGELRHVRGCLSHAIEARNNNHEFFLCPYESSEEASLVDKIKVIPIKNLREAYEFLCGRKKIPAIMRASLDVDYSNFEDLQDVKGQASAKRALEIAASGGHNVLMIGPPGTGKSMISKRLPGILPNMQEEEILETSKIYSVCGVNVEDKKVVSMRPFRAPHHTISDAGLLGGGSNPKPGEISLAHNGVLFLDELPEFRRTTLEVLRQPLEDGFVTISRASGTVTFPSNFMLIAAMNPCPCGYYGDLERQCKCSGLQVDNYRSRVSGPLLDRIDIHIEIPRIAFRKFINEKSESSKEVRKRVLNARNIQVERFKGDKKLHCNAEMPSKLLKECCGIDDESEEFFEYAMKEMQLSARAHDKILKVARTIADLEGSESIEHHHLTEAVQYRSLDKI